MNLSIITQITDIPSDLPSDFGNPSIQSIEMSAQGTSGIDVGAGVVLGRPHFHVSVIGKLHIPSHE